MTQAQNQKVINKCFKELRTRMKTSLQDGMEELLRKGVEYCLDAHDSSHQAHLEMGDSYAWLLQYNGKVVNQEISVQGGQGQGNATKQLAQIRTYLSGLGWEGIVLAGMQPDNYFSWAYEFIPMREGMRDLKRVDFSKIFKPIHI